MTTKTVTWNINDDRTLSLYIAYLQEIGLSIQRIYLTKTKTDDHNNLTTTREAIIICTENKETILPSKINTKETSIDKLIEEISNEVYDFHTETDKDKYQIIKGLQGLIRELETTLEPEPEIKTKDEAIQAINELRAQIETIKFEWQLLGEYKEDTFVPQEKLCTYKEPHNLGFHDIQPTDEPTTNNWAKEILSILNNWEEHNKEDDQYVTLPNQYPMSPKDWAELKQKATN